MDVRLLDDSHEAEDECIKDFRKVLRKSSGQFKENTDPAAAGKLRSNSDELSEKRGDADLLHPDIGRMRDIAQPGGFRREHILKNAEHGKLERLSSYITSHLTELLLPRLMLPGLKDMERRSSVRSFLDVEQVAQGDNASNLTTAIIIGKLFFSSSFLLMPGGFRNAGLMLGPLMLLFVYAVEIIGMLNLIDCRDKMGPGYRYEDMGVVLGSWGPSFITFVIMLTQVGIVCVWLVSTVENLSMVLPDWNSTDRLLLLLPIITPFVWVRRLRFFAVTNLLALLIGISAAVALTIFGVSKLLRDGKSESVEWVNTQNGNSLLWFGSCSYVYECIGYILPVYESAGDKPAMRKLLIASSMTITAIFILIGCLFYLSFGDETAAMATLNLPADSAIGIIIPPMFSLVGVVTIPLNVFIIFQMYEPRCTWPAGYHSRKWSKNLCRCVVLVGTFILTWLGGQQLQNFLALVGGLCCVTLAFLIPSLLHLAICQPVGLMRYIDISSFVIGILIMFSSCGQAIINWK